VRGLLALQRQRLGLGGRNLGLHARHVQLGRIAGPEALLDQRQRLAIGHQTLLDQLAFGLQRTQLQIGLCHIGLHHQARALQ
jgi:hypothetical protein